MIGVTALLPGSPDRPGSAHARRAGRSARPPRPARRRPSSPPRAAPPPSGRPPSAGCAASWRRRRPPRRCGRLPVSALSQAICLAAGLWQAHRPRQSSRPASSGLLRQRHVCAALQHRVAAPGAQVASAVLSRWAHRPNPQHHNAPPGCAGGRHRTALLQSGRADRGAAAAQEAGARIATLQGKLAAAEADGARGRAERAALAAACDAAAADAQSLQARHRREPGPGCRAIFAWSGGARHGMRCCCHAS
jgi:hypothetical protein